MKSALSVSLLKKLVTPSLHTTLESQQLNFGTHEKRICASPLSNLSLAFYLGSLALSSDVIGLSRAVVASASGESSPSWLNWEPSESGRVKSGHQPSEEEIN